MTSEWGSPEGRGGPIDDETRPSMALWLGVGSLVAGFFCVVGYLPGPFAVAMGWKSLRLSYRSNGELGGRWRARIGIVTGLASTILLVVFVLLALGVLGTGTTDNMRLF